MNWWEREKLKLQESDRRLEALRKSDPEAFKKEMVPWNTKRWKEKTQG